MAPAPQEHDSTRVDMLVTDSAVQDLPLDGDSIVISGLSGLYPQSRNVKELADILYTKVSFTNYVRISFKIDWKQFDMKIFYADYTRSVVILIHLSNSKD